MIPAPRFGTLDALLDPEALGRLVGPIDRIEREPMAAPGFSGSSHERVHVRLRSGATAAFVLKRVSRNRAWTAFRTNDRLGREAGLLAEPALAPVWDSFASPYVAYAIAGDEIGLLMHDLSDHLFPDVRVPLADREEGALLGALAAMHARFWNAPALDLDWLARDVDLTNMLGPHAAPEVAATRGTHPFFIKVGDGWSIALAAMPAAVRALVTRPAAELAARYADLPRTLVHGDCKVANFAPLPDGRVAAFDWSCLAAAPAALELGWYLAINASRLCASKEDTIARYRGLLETSIGTTLGAAAWRRYEEYAVIGGALMLLWSKALALDAGAPWARAEWEWWMTRLAPLAS